MFDNQCMLKMETMGQINPQYVAGDISYYLKVSKTLKRQPWGLQYFPFLYSAQYSVRFMKCCTQ